MTSEEFKSCLDSDSYLKQRKQPTEAEEQLYLKETKYHCCLCGKNLRHRKQAKGVKQYQIAHIYPNRPTQEQYTALKGLDRLGSDSEAFENKIALCRDCHATQDYHTTAEEYLRLVGIKCNFMKETALEEATFDLGLEEAIADVINHIVALRDEEFSELNYAPVSLTKKFQRSDRLLKTRVSEYVTNYYPYIRDLFKNMDGQNGFSMNVLCMEIKAAFIKLSSITDDKTAIFDRLVDWVYTKTLMISKPACEAIVSFFVQNCEVFYEITE